MLYKIARLCQLAGLVILPIALVGNIAKNPPPLDLRESLALSSLGVLLFIIGWALQEFVKPKQSAACGLALAWSAVEQCSIFRRRER